MSKEWILNSIMNRFQLNFKRNVGPTSESIRLCAPKDLKEWRNYYFSKVRSEEHIRALGRKLFLKIHNVVRAELESITEEDCIRYMDELVIDRTFDGYLTEIDTIFRQLQQHIKIPIQPASDEWDRVYNVDFFIPVRSSFIGLQIKPLNQGIQMPELFKEYAIQEESHKRFTEQFGGKVFYLFSARLHDSKEIQNPEVIPEIIHEIERLNTPPLLGSF